MEYLNKEFKLSVFSLLPLFLTHSAVSFLWWPQYALKVGIESLVRFAVLISYLNVVIHILSFLGKMLYSIIFQKTLKAVVQHFGKYTPKSSWELDEKIKIPWYSSALVDITPDKRAHKCIFQLQSYFF